MDNKNEYLILASVSAIFFIIFGTLLGAILNLIGFCQVSVTSWQYWLGFASILVPGIAALVLQCHRISITSTFGFMIYCYACFIPSMVTSSLVLGKWVDLKQYFIAAAVFTLVYPWMRYITEHPWIKARIESIKQRFFKK